jgi:hypothetical protein
MLGFKRWGELYEFDAKILPQSKLYPFLVFLKYQKLVLERLKIRIQNVATLLKRNRTVFIFFFHAF